MPTAKDPSLQEFYVYALETHGMLFYVGHGRAKRAPDRVRYVEYLMRRQKQNKPVKWNKANEVAAEFLRGEHKIHVCYLCHGLSKANASDREQKEIARLRSSGVMLASYQHNEGGPSNAKALVRHVLSRSAHAGHAVD